MTVLPWEIAPQDAEGHLWDAIVVGTGAGGSTAGFNLARLGRSVLFVERGKLLHHDPNVVRGVPFSGAGDSEKALNYGWWPRSVDYREEEGGASVPTNPPIGAGAGGSTAQFSAVMDRFRPQDFTPRRFFRTCLMHHCPRPGQSPTRRWCPSTSGQRNYIGYEARKTR